MKKIAALLLIAGSLSSMGCAAGIARYGYTLADLKSLPVECKIAIKQNMNWDANAVEIRGKVKVYDTQFSLKCSEEYVFALLTKEGCALGADVINITEEKYPDFWSTCYQVKAEFIMMKNRQLAEGLTSDAKYDHDKIRQRSKETEKRNAAAMGAIGGAVGAPVVAPR